MQHQEWTTVICSKNKSNIKDKQKNISRQNPEGTSVFRALDSVEPPAPKKIDLDISKAIQKTRVIKNMSQKDLANKCSIPVNIIIDYENGKAIVDRKLVLKISNILGIKLI